jgi:hypothetical protein
VKRRLTCDVTGCGAPRPRGHRICASCFARLPGNIRVGIIEAYHQRRTKDWQQLRRQAAEFLGIKPLARVIAAEANRISPQRAFELQARLLGERVDL